MFKLLALNETSQSASSSDKPLRDTKEAQEAQAFKLYNEALRLQQIDCREEAVQVYEQLLKTPLVVESATTLVNEHNEAIEHPLKDSGLILKYSAHKNVASICASKGDNKKAMENYLQAVMLDTSDVTLWYKIGILAANLSNLHLSRRALTQGLECNPNHWPCLDSLISVCYAILDYENCLRWISKAMSKDSFYKKGIFLRRKMIKECPHLKRDFDHLFKNCGSRVFEMVISEEDGDEFLQEALTLRENFRKLCIPEKIPVVALQVPLKSLSWLNLGKSLIATYKFIENQEEPVSITSPIDMKVFDGIGIESNLCEVIRDVEMVKVENKCGKSQDKQYITDSDSKSNCTTYEPAGSSQVAETSNGSRVSDVLNSADASNLNKSRKAMKRKRPPEKISEQGRRSERRSSRMKPRSQKRSHDEPSPNLDLDFRHSLLKLLPKNLQTNMKPLSIDTDSDTNSQDSSILCPDQPVISAASLIANSDTPTVQSFQNEICLSSDAVAHVAADVSEVIAVETEALMSDSSQQKPSSSNTALIICTEKSDSMNVHKVCMPVSQLTGGASDKISSGGNELTDSSHQNPSSSNSEPPIWTDTNNSMNVQNALCVTTTTSQLTNDAPEKISVSSVEMTRTDSSQQNSSSSKPADEVSGTSPGQKQKRDSDSSTVLKEPSIKPVIEADLVDDCQRMKQIEIQTSATVGKVLGQESEEECQVRKFIEKYNDKNNGILNLLLMFCKSVGRLSHVKWETGLKEVFLQAFDIMQPGLRVEPFIKCNLSTEDKVSFAYYMLTHLECSLDCKYKKHSKDFKYCPSELEYRDMGFIIDASYHPEVLELDSMLQYRFKNFVLRFHWVRATYFFLSGDKRSVIGELTMCSKLCMDTEIKLRHLENHNVINLEMINRRINSLKRFQLLEEIEHLLECEDFAEALKLLKANMKSSEQYLHEVCASLPSGNSVDLERPKLLNYFIKASVGLGDMHTLSENLLNCLHESVQQLPLHVKKSSKASKCHDSWQTICAMCCSNLADIVNKNKDILKSLAKSALTMFINDLISLNHHHLTNLPTKSQTLLKGSKFDQICTPWVLLFHATKVAEGCFDEFRGTTGELPPSVLMLISAHDWFGERSYCCANNGALLRLLLKELMEYINIMSDTSMTSNDKLAISFTDSEKSRDTSQNNANTATYVEQCFFCLFGYPNKLSKSSRLVDHGSQSLTLKWQDAFLLYKYFKPACLPAFDSYKVNTILNDMAGLLQKILKIVPDKAQGKLTHSLKILDAYLKAEDITKEIEMETICSEEDHLILGDVYYLLADYYFKNKDMPQAGKYYMYDICINPRRFDSWAALALVKSSILDQRIRMCSSKLHNQVTGKEESILVYSKSTLFCFKKAMKIEGYSTTLWIEYGTFAYWIHSYFSRQIKMKKHASEEVVALWKKKKASMLNQAEICFECALGCDSDDISSEEWLILYMLGKVQEKKCESPQKFLPRYSRAASLLHQKHAKYPKKIQFKSYQTDYAIESLEMYFRIHCSILKMVQHEINVLNGFDDGDERTPLTKEDFDLFTDIIEEAEGSNFVRRESLQSQQFYDKPPDSNSKRSAPQTKLATSVHESHATLSMGSLVPDAIVSALSSQLGVDSSANEMLMETDCTVSTQLSSLDSGTNSTQVHLIGEKGLPEHLQREEISAESAAPLSKERKLELCSKTLKSCVSALHLCLGRLPQHYKAIYRLADLYWRCSPDSQHISWCCDLLLGSSTPWQAATHMPCQALLSERNKTNLFNGVWKIPVDEIDRPGSFGYHLYRCIMLLMDVLLAIKDHRKLFYLHNMLNRTPDQGKKYLKDTDRVLLCKKSLSYCIKALYKKVSCINTTDRLSHSERLQYLMDAAKICQQKQRMSDPAEDILPKKQTEMHKELLILSYEKYIVELPPIATPLPNLDFIPAVVKVERILKFCQQHTSSFPSTPKSHLSSISQQFDFNMVSVARKIENESTAEKHTDPEADIDISVIKPVRPALEAEQQLASTPAAKDTSSSSDVPKRKGDTMDCQSVLKTPSKDTCIANVSNFPRVTLPSNNAASPECFASFIDNKVLTDAIAVSEKLPLAKSQILYTSNLQGSDGFVVKEPNKVVPSEESGCRDNHIQSIISDDTTHEVIGSRPTSVQAISCGSSLTNSLMTETKEKAVGDALVSSSITTVVSGCLTTQESTSTFKTNRPSILPKAEVTTVTQMDKSYTKIIPCKQNPSLSPSPHSAFTPRKRLANLNILKIERDNKGLLARSTSLPETLKSPIHKNLHRTVSISEYTKQRLKSSILMKTSASLVKKPSITATEMDQILCDIESSQSEDEEDAEANFQPLIAAPTEPLTHVQQSPQPKAVTPVAQSLPFESDSDDT